MVNVDISNIWCSVSLPDLLKEEKTVFDAHLSLSGGMEKQNGWLGHLYGPEGAGFSWLDAALDAADRIRRDSDKLVVAGGGLTAMGARAAASLCRGRPGAMPMVFCGEDFSPARWLDVVGKLEAERFSVLVISATGKDPASLLCLRSLRRIMEVRCGEEMRSRIYISAPEGSVLHRIGETEGFNLLPNVGYPCGGTVFSAAGAILIALNGLRAERLISGAAGAARNWDIRSFENPLWLYAGAMTALKNAGITEQTLCTAAPEANAFGTWWQNTLLKRGVSALHAAVPARLDCAAHRLLAKNQFASFLTTVGAGKKVSVDMDWRDLDGYNCLAGKDLGQVEEKALEAVQEVLGRENVPFIGISCEEELLEAQVGEILYFVEFSAALTAVCGGESAFLREKGNPFAAEIDAVLTKKFPDI